MRITGNHLYDLNFIAADPEFDDRIIPAVLVFANPAELNESCAFDYDKFLIL